MWKIPVFLRMHKMWLTPPQVKGHIIGVAMQRNPQHFHREPTGLVPLRTSHPHVCAQPAGKLGWLDRSGEPRIVLKRIWIVMNGPWPYGSSPCVGAATVPVVMT